MPFLHYISSLEGTSYKALQDTVTRSFTFLLFLLTFTSADIIFHKFLELHSTLSEKKNFVTNFPLLTN